MMKTKRLVASLTLLVIAAIVTASPASADINVDVNLGNVEINPIGGCK